MTEHYNEVQRCVKAFFDQSLLQGHPLIAIVDSFKGGPIPQDLLNSPSCKGLSEREIRRHGQLVASKYLIKDHYQQSAELPESDLLATTVVDKELGV